jgi:hypothetical protein
MNTDHDRLFGRVVALDLIVRGVMTNILLQTRDPLAALQQLRQDMLAALQRLTWPANSHTEILNGAVAAVNEHFDGVAERVGARPQSAPRPR